MVTRFDQVRGLWSLVAVLVWLTISGTSRNVESSSDSTLGFRCTSRATTSSTLNLMVDNLQEQIQPKWVYHGTTRHRAQQILKDGLKPTSGEINRAGDVYSPAVHV